MSAQEIFSLRRQGNHRHALEQARAEYGNGSSDIWLLRAYGWVLYDHAKHVVEAWEAKEVAPATLSSQLSVYMKEFSVIGEPLRKDSVFSQMLRLAGKASKDWEEFMLFARWAGIEDFEEKDTKPFVTDDGKTLDSLQKRFIRAICRATANSANDNNNQKLIEWGKGVLDHALSEAPNDQWLNYYLSKFYVAKGDFDSACKRLLPLVRRQSSANWVWQQLGEILEPNQPQDAITCFGRATQLTKDEQMLSKTRIHLARLLSKNSRFNEAAFQVKRTLAFREQQGNKVPPELSEMVKSQWYQNAIANDLCEPLSGLEDDAKTLLSRLGKDSLQYTRGFVDHINETKGLSYVAFSVDTGIPVFHKKFPDIASLAPGTIVELGFSEGEEFPDDWRPCDATEIPGLCGIFEGKCTRPEGKGFGFIRSPRGDVFVPPQFIEQCLKASDAHVQCIAAYRSNKKGQSGWRVVRLLDESSGIERDQIQGDLSHDDI